LNCADEEIQDTAVAVIAWSHPSGIRKYPMERTIMDSRRKTAFLIAALALTGTFASAVARADAIEAKTLRGIDRITVVIKLFHPDEFTGTGVTEQVLQPLIESELQKNGIKVVDSSDIDAPELFVDLNALRTSPSALTTSQSHSYASQHGIKAERYSCTGF
jgi:hypothetical protein